MWGVWLVADVGRRQSSGQLASRPPLWPRPHWDRRVGAIGQQAAKAGSSVLNHLHELHRRRMSPSRRTGSTSPAPWSQSWTVPFSDRARTECRLRPSRRPSGPSAPRCVRGGDIINDIHTSVSPPPTSTGKRDGVSCGSSHRGIEKASPGLTRTGL